MILLNFFEHISFFPSSIATWLELSSLLTGSLQLIWIVSSRPLLLPCNPLCTLLSFKSQTLHCFLTPTYKLSFGFFSESYTATSVPGPYVEASLTAWNRAIGTMVHSYFWNPFSSFVLEKSTQILLEWIHVTLRILKYLTRILTKFNWFLFLIKKNSHHD